MIILAKNAIILFVFVLRSHFVLSLFTYGEYNERLSSVVRNYHQMSKIMTKFAPPLSLAKFFCSDV